MTAITPTPAAIPATTASTSERAALKKAAQGFEAIFVRQMLSAARAASLADKDDAIFGGQAQETFAAMRDERFAEIAAQSGAFGLAKQLEAQFARLLPAAAPARKD